MVKQTTFRTYDAKTVGNISLPYGLVATVRAGFRRLRLYDYLDGFKEKCVPLSYVIELMCIHLLDGGSSMNKCSSLSNSPLVKDELCHGYTISRKTIERSLGLLDQYFEDILGFVWSRLNDLYAFINTDVYVDGSHVERYGPKGPTPPPERAAEPYSCRISSWSHSLRTPGFRS